MKAKKTAPPSGPARRKVVVDFPQHLLDETKRAAGELAVNRSSFIRAAVTEYIRQLKQRNLERLLAEGYAANAELSRRIAAEFTHVDSKLA